MESKIFGYARVSSKDQNLARQMAELINYGINERDIFADKKSGKDFSREEYQNMLRMLRKGDTVVVKSIDRLGRNYNQILEEWQRLTKEIGVDIVVLDMPLLDTRKRKDLLGTLITDIVLQLLSYVAENERENIRQRQSEGIKLAKTRGVQFGRPKIKLPDNWEICYQNWKAGKMTAIQFMKEVNMKKDTFYSKVKEYEAKN